MKTWVRKTLSVGVLAAGALLVSSTAAHADVDQNTWDNNGLGNGIQIVSGITAPVNIVGNAIGVAGEANAAGAGVNSTEGHRKVKQNSKDNNGVLNGLQAYAPAYIPVNVVGNAAAVAGEANAAGSGVNKRTESTRTEGKKKGGDDDDVTQNSWDNNGILNGAQLYFPIEIPINLCGNAIALLGEANAQAHCSNGGWMTESASAEQNSTDNNGALNGVQVLSGLHMPVNLSGNSIAALGEANAAAVSHNSEGGHDDITQNSSDNNGVGNGLQIAAPVDVPINVCGNALGILGEANAAAACSNGGGKGGHKGNHHDDNDGDGDGNDDGDEYNPDNGAEPDGDEDNYKTSDQPRKAHGAKAHSKSAATEASPVGGLTDGLTQGGNVPSFGGLNLLKTLG